MIDKILFSYLALILIAIPNFSKSELTIFEPRSPLPSNTANKGSPWPIPQEWKYSDQIASIYNFSFKFRDKLCPPIEFAMKKYENSSFHFYDGESIDITHPILDTIYILVENEEDCGEDRFPKFTEDPEYEAYNLMIGIDGTVEQTETPKALAKIESKTIWGALRGMETFTQLIWSEKSALGRHFYVNFTTIGDFPRFPHRGIMIDTARHYIYPSTIITILDAMMYNKFNVLHWHMVDDQSFPFVSRTFPELSREGAYNGELVYTPEIVHQIQIEARNRGIRVIFEFDTPGHTGGFGKSHSELLTNCSGNSLHKHINRLENFDPSNPDLYNFTRKFFSEIVQSVSRDSFIHLGLDEVFPECWKSSNSISSFMKEMGLTSLAQVEGYYAKKHIEMIKSLGGIPIVWQDPIDQGIMLDTEVVVEAWKDFGQPWPTQIQKILNLGHRVIFSSCWYINYINYGESWKKYYLCDPVKNVTTIKEDQKRLVLGGEAAIWAEFVDDTNIVTRLFPFASAVAEKLWSSIEATILTSETMYRLDEHRCRMLRRGIQAQPILPGYCEDQKAPLIIDPLISSTDINFAGDSGILYLVIGISITISICFIGIAFNCPYLYRRKIDNKKYELLRTEEGRDNDINANETDRSKSI